MSKGETDVRSNLAAVYIRMSTEHQQYSIINQMKVIREDAKRRGLEIVREYSDAGKSGLSIQGRGSLAQMVQDVQSKEGNFSNILVYDVSRWGRFQDADESAYYEYLCRRAGVSVHYCAEQFENDGSPISTIIKSVKRTMAGEFSRELSGKVFRGACTLIELGFKQGGTAGFGLRRMLIDLNGQKKGVLGRRERKSLQTDRVVLVAGPEEEVKVVRWIYKAFIVEGKSEIEIAAALNAQGILTDWGRCWTRVTVHEILTNEKYIGNNVYHRTSCKLKGKRVVNPPDMWIRADGVFEGIIKPEMFLRARAIILARNKKFSDEEMLEKLRGLLKEHGRISGILIDEAEGMPSRTVFGHRFGTLANAYQLIGYDRGVDFSFIEANRRLRKQHPEIVASVVQKIGALGGMAAWDPKTQLLKVNDELRVSIVLCRHTTTKAGSSRWFIRLDAGLKPDITIAARMDAVNERVRDYYVLPGIDLTWENLRVAEENGVYLDVYRCESLDYFFTLTERIKVQKEA